MLIKIGNDYINIGFLYLMQKVFITNSKN